MTLLYYVTIKSLLLGLFCCSAKSAMWHDRNDFLPMSDERCDGGYSNLIFIYTIVADDRALWNVFALNPMITPRRFILISKGKNTRWEGGVRAVGFVWSPLLNLGTRRKSNRQDAKRSTMTTPSRRVTAAGGDSVVGVRWDKLMHMVDWVPTLLSAAGTKKKHKTQKKKTRSFCRLLPLAAFGRQL
jgi:hypothetical protein